MVNLPLVRALRRPLRGWRPPSGVAGVVCALALLLGTLSGCAPEQRYRVLSFVFDGVPSPGARPQVGAKRRRRGKRGETRKEFEQQMQARLAKVFQHGPFASKHCPACHATGKAASSYVIPGTGRRGIPKFGPKLRYAKKDLCRHCHERFRPAVLAERQRYTHGPVAAGACLRCHSPHMTPNRYMIRKRPIRQICLQCHDPAEIFVTPYHAEVRKERDCTDCHDPHGGNRRYFLRTPSPVAPPAPAEGPQAPPGTEAGGRLAAARVREVGG